MTSVHSDLSIRRLARSYPLGPQDEDTLRLSWLERSRPRAVRRALEVAMSELLDREQETRGAIDASRSLTRLRSMEKVERAKARKAQDARIAGLPVLSPAPEAAPEAHNRRTSADYFRELRRAEREAALEEATSLRRSDELRRAERAAAREAAVDPRRSHEPDVRGIEACMLPTRKWRLFKGAEPRPDLPPPAGEQAPCVEELTQTKARALRRAAKHAEATRLARDHMQASVDREIAEAARASGDDAIQRHNAPPDQEAAQPRDDTPLPSDADSLELSSDEDAGQAEGGPAPARRYTQVAGAAAEACRAHLASQFMGYDWAGASIKAQDRVEARAAAQPRGATRTAYDIACGSVAVAHTTMSNAANTAADVFNGVVVVGAALRAVGRAHGRAADLATHAQRLPLAIDEKGLAISIFFADRCGDCDSKRSKAFSADSMVPVHALCTALGLHGGVHDLARVCRALVSSFLAGRGITLDHRRVAAVSVLLRFFLEDYAPDDLAEWITPEVMLRTPPTQAMRSILRTLTAKELRLVRDCVIAFSPDSREPELPCFNEFASTLKTMAECRDACPCPRSKVRVLAGLWVAYNHLAGPLFDVPGRVIRATTTTAIEECTVTQALQTLPIVSSNNNSAQCSVIRIKNHQHWLILFTMDILEWKPDHSGLIPGQFVAVGNQRYNLSEYEVICDFKVVNKNQVPLGLACFAVPFSHSNAIKGSGPAFRVWDAQAPTSGGAGTAIASGDRIWAVSGLSACKDEYGFLAIPENALNSLQPGHCGSLLITGDCAVTAAFLGRQSKMRYLQRTDTIIASGTALVARTECKLAAQQRETLIAASAIEECKRKRADANPVDKDAVEKEYKSATEAVRDAPSDIAPAPALVAAKPALAKKPTVRDTQLRDIATKAATAQASLSKAVFRVSANGTHVPWLPKTASQLESLIVLPSGKVFDQYGLVYLKPDAQVAAAAAAKASRVGPTGPMTPNQERVRDQVRDLAALFPTHAAGLGFELVTDIRGTDLVQLARAIATSSKADKGLSDICSFSHAQKVAHLKASNRTATSTFSKRDWVDMMSASEETTALFITEVESCIDAIRAGTTHRALVMDVFCKDEANKKGKVIEGTPRTINSPSTVASVAMASFGFLRKGEQFYQLDAVCAEIGAEHPDPKARGLWGSIAVGLAPWDMVARQRRYAGEAYTSDVQEWDHSIRPEWAEHMVNPLCTDATVRANLARLIVSNPSLRSQGVAIYIKGMRARWPSGLLTTLFANGMLNVAIHLTMHDLGWEALEHHEQPTFLLSVMGDDSLSSRPSDPAFYASIKMRLKEGTVAKLNSFCSVTLTEDGPVVDLAKIVARALAKPTSMATAPLAFDFGVNMAVLLRVTGCSPKARIDAIASANALLVDYVTSGAQGARKDAILSFMTGLHSGTLPSGASLDDVSAYIEECAKGKSKSASRVWRAALQKEGGHSKTYYNEERHAALVDRIWSEGDSDDDDYDEDSDFEDDGDREEFTAATYRKRQQKLNAMRNAGAVASPKLRR